MHKIKINDNLVRTDLILEKNPHIKNLHSTKYNGINISKNKDNNYKYTTIFFDDITDSLESKHLEEVLIAELKDYINPKPNDIFLVIGLGNQKSTPDSLGPLTIDNIIPTRYLFSFGEVDKSYSNVSIYKPDVIGNTGIESISIIKSIIKEIKATKVIVIDALKANNIDRLIKTIQITNSGIHPGSGINNNRGEISEKTTMADVIAIGIPTVVDINSLLDKDNLSYIVTPTNIDFVIERLAYILGDSLNIILHNHHNRQITI